MYSALVVAALSKMSRANGSDGGLSIPGSDAHGDAHGVWLMVNSITYQPCIIMYLYQFTINPKKMPILKPKPDQPSRFFSIHCTPHGLRILQHQAATGQDVPGGSQQIRQGSKGRVALHMAFPKDLHGVQRDGDAWRREPPLVASPGSLPWEVIILNHSPP